MADETVAARVLQSGELTSEHAVMTDASNFGRVLTYIGTISALLPQLLDLVHLLPAGLQESKYVQILLAVVGGLLAVLGVVKETSAKFAYIQGRSMIKASALRDVAPETTVTSTDVPK